MEQRNKKIFIICIVCYTCLMIFCLVCIFVLKTNNDKINIKIDSLKANLDKEEYDISEINEQIELYSSIDERINNKYDEYFTNISLLEKRITNNEVDVKIAYFTFDDGPYNLTTKVLDVLKRNDIRATFFVLGKSDFDDTYKQIVEDGHTLANHTYYHNITKGLYDSPDSFMEQVKNLENYLYEMTGYRTNLVRFPGGSQTAGKYKDEIINRLHESGYNYVDWNAETGDGSDKKMRQKDAFSWAKETVGDKKIVVLLMHDYNMSTYNNLQNIIDYLKEKNYIFLPLSRKSMMTH